MSSTIDRGFSFKRWGSGIAAGVVLAPFAALACARETNESRDVTPAPVNVGGIVTEEGYAGAVHSESGSSAIVQNDGSSLAGEASKGAIKGEIAPEPGLKDLNGMEVRLESFRGQTVLLFNYNRQLSGSEQNLTEVAALEAQYLGKLQVITVVISEGIGRKVEQKTRLVLLNELEKFNGIYNFGYPATFLIGKDGVLIDYKRGVIDDNFKNKIAASVAGE